jgi:hypothetical protein
MRMRTRRTVIGAVAVVGAVMVPTAQPASALGGCDGPGGGTEPLGVSGPSLQATAYGARVSVQGTAGERADVGVWFRRAFTSEYVQRRSLVADCYGAWSTSYVANDDYRLYATSGTGQTPSVLIQIAPTIAGAASQVVKKGSTYTITGTGIPGKVLTLHFHKAGTPANDYSIRRTVTINSEGAWSRPYAATVDYRFFASLSNGQKSRTVLVQAR